MLNTQPGPSSFLHRLLQKIPFGGLWDSQNSFSTTSKKLIEMGKAWRDSERCESWFCAVPTLSELSLSSVSPSLENKIYPRNVFSTDVYYMFTFDTGHSFPSGSCKLLKREELDFSLLSFHSFLTRPGRAVFCTTLFPAYKRLVSMQCFTSGNGTRFPSTWNAVRHFEF